MELIHLLSGMANNLNQIARMSYIKGEVHDWEAIREISHFILELFKSVKTDSFVQIKTATSWNDNIKV